MKIAIMTDMEGVAGVLNFKEWVFPESSMFYREGIRLLTEEVNAAIGGFFEGGATEIVVIDGHGGGRGLYPELIDERVSFACRVGGHPWILDKSFNGLAFVGQHAKAGTSYSHLTHTGTAAWIDFSINGISMGEYGQLALCAMELGFPTIFASGEEALCKEAEALTPGVVSVAVKKGTVAFDDGFPLLTAEQYETMKLGAIHLAPKRARPLIREGARQAVLKLKRHPDSFKYPSIKPPYVRMDYYRRNNERPAFRQYREHPDSIIELFNPRCKEYRCEWDQQPTPTSK